MRKFDDGLALRQKVCVPCRIGDLAVLSLLCLRSSFSGVFPYLVLRGKLTREDESTCKPRMLFDVFNESMS